MTVNISSELQAHIGGEVTTLATCWRIVRRDGVALGFTTHDRDLRVDHMLYKATSGFQASAMESSSAYNVDNLDVEGILQHSGVTDAAILAGRYDLADIEIFLVNWAAPEEGRIVLRSGWIGEITLAGGAFTAEMRGRAQMFQTRVGQAYSPECRAAFGDARCKIDPSAFTVSGAVTEVTDSQTFRDAERGEADGWFDYGVLTWMSGGNAGLQSEVRHHATGGFTLFLPMPAVIAVGDRYRVHAGCDKRFQTCRTKFDNGLNFRGEPYLPGQDAVFDYPGLR